MSIVSSSIFASLDRSLSLLSDCLCLVSVLSHTLTGTLIWGALLIRRICHLVYCIEAFFCGTFSNVGDVVERRG